MENHISALRIIGRSSAAIRKSRVSVRMVTPYSFSARNSVRPGVAGMFNVSPPRRW